MCILIPKATIDDSFLFEFRFHSLRICPNCHFIPLIQSPLSWYHPFHKNLVSLHSLCPSLYYPVFRDPTSETELTSGEFCLSKHAVSRLLQGERILNKDRPLSPNVPVGTEGIQWNTKQAGTALLTRHSKAICTTNRSESSRKARMPLWRKRSRFTWV